MLLIHATLRATIQAMIQRCRWLVAILAITLLAACGPASADTPAVSATVPPTALAQAQPTVEPALQPAMVVEFWTTDQQPERIEAYNAVAMRLMAAHPEI